MHTAVTHVYVITGTPIESYTLLYLCLLITMKLLHWDELAAICSTSSSRAFRPPAFNKLLQYISHTTNFETNNNVDAQLKQALVICSILNRSHHVLFANTYAILIISRIFKFRAFYYSAVNQRLF